MAELYEVEQAKKVYWDKMTYTSLEAHLEALRDAKTLYIGNLSFYTIEPQIYELFSSVGMVTRVIMGLDRIKKTPCGFCFVEFETHEEAVAGSNYLSGTTLDDRVIRCEMDGGFRDGRQFGRGSSGGQVRDDRRSTEDYDAGRGGYGKSTGLRSFARGGEFPQKRKRSLDNSAQENSSKVLNSGSPNVQEEDKNLRFRPDNEDMKDEDMKDEDIKDEDIKDEDIKDEDIKDEDIKDEDIKDEDNVKDEDIKDQDIKGDDNVKDDEE